MQQPDRELTIANLRMSCPFVLLVVHQAIREQLDFRRNLKESYIFDESPKSNPASSSGSSPPGPGSENVAMLEELHLQSVDVLLHNCRSQMEMYKVSPMGREDRKDTLDEAMLTGRQSCRLGWYRASRTLWRLGNRPDFQLLRSSCGCSSPRHNSWPKYRLSSRDTRPTR